MQFSIVLYLFDVEGYLSLGLVKRIQLTLKCTNYQVTGSPILVPPSPLNSILCKIIIKIITVRVDQKHKINI